MSFMVYFIQRGYSPSYYRGSSNSSFIGVLFGMMALNTLMVLPFIFVLTHSRSTELSISSSLTLPLSVQSIKRARVIGFT